jgi:hypothetical protein
MTSYKSIYIYIRSICYRIFSAVTRTSRFKDEIRNILKDTLHTNHILNEKVFLKDVPEYEFLGKSDSCEKTYKIKSPIFITARFRSGSTMLWNIFRKIGGFTCFYEPLLHEKPSERGKTKGYRIDSSHIGVENYHEEFKGIKTLDGYHKYTWAYENLYMSEFDFDYELEKYIEILIENSVGTPVLQFNRIDFRLGWIKKVFPKAKILHIFRNPRDQWISMIYNDIFIPKDYCFRDDFYPNINAFYLIDWWKDLKIVMPFLELRYLKHPYQIHYLLWRVSYMFGKKYSDLSLCFENLILQKEKYIKIIFDFAKIDQEQYEKVKDTVSNKIQINK